VNSRAKGARGERLWRDELRANGYEARRGQQFSGSPDSPDVVCEELAWLHFEVKCVERLNIEDAMEQAHKDAVGEGAKGNSRGARAPQKIPIVAHKRNHRAWLVTMTAETFFRLLRGEFNDGARGATRPTTEEVPGGSPSTAGETPAIPNSLSAAACAAANPANTKTNTD
jgi:Holliday junction resolvase